MRYVCAVVATIVLSAFSCHTVVVDPADSTAPEIWSGLWVQLDSTETPTLLARMPNDYTLELPLEDSADPWIGVIVQANDPESGISHVSSAGQVRYRCRYDDERGESHDLPGSYIPEPGPAQGDPVGAEEPTFSHSRTGFAFYLSHLWKTGPCGSASSGSLLDIEVYVFGLAVNNANPSLRSPPLMRRFVIPNRRVDFSD